MRKISLGTTNKQITYAKHRKFGVTEFISLPRVGKSVLARAYFINLYKDIVRNPFRNERIIIFDVRGEWFDKITNMNYRAKSPFAIPLYDIIHINDLAFPLSYFPSAEHWVGFNVPPESADTLSYLTKYYEVYEDSPEEFGKLVRQVPTSHVTLIQFNRKFEQYGIQLPLFLPYSIVVSMNRKLDQLIRKGCFKQKDDGKTAITDEDWERLLEKNKVIIINFKMSDEVDKFKSRAYTGVILEQLTKFLGMYHFNFFFEEADYLFPYVREMEDLRMPMSVIKASEYVMKFQKFHINMLFITQKERAMCKGITSFATTRIVGKASPDDYEYNVKNGAKCYWNPEQNVREFCITYEGGYSRVFEPFESECEP